MKTQKQTAQHTPTPWKTGDLYIWGADGEPLDLAARPRPERKANAEFIIRACNSHDELVAALGSAQSWLAGYMAQTPDLIDVRRKVEAALAKATGNG